MSRLDDELKIAFRRKQPPPDFAARVLARLDSSAPAKKTGWRGRLASIFELPGRRWVAVGAAASLLMAIAAFWYLQPRPVAVDVNTPIAEAPSGPKTESAQNKNEARPEVTQQSNPAVDNNNVPAPPNKAPKFMQVKHRRNLMARRAEPKVSPEAEAAKEKVLFALQIAGNTFNDAQRAMRYDSDKPKSQPERNR